MAARQIRLNRVFMARQASGLPARFEYLLFGAAQKSLKALPRKQAARLGSALGSMASRLDRFNRPVAMRNLEIAFPERTIAQRRAILQAMYRDWGMIAAEWCHRSEITKETVAQFAALEGAEHWRRLRGIFPDSGGLILTGHYGNFELLAAAFALHGERVAIVHRPLRNALINSAIVEARQSAGIAVIQRKGAARQILSAVRSGVLVAIPIDLDVRRGVFVDFFSKKACTTEGLARLAEATGAPVVPAFMVREGTSLRHKITILPPVEVVPETDSSAVLENTQRFTAVFEEMVRRHPHHWNWIHRRWKTRPPGEARFY